MDKRKLIACPFCDENPTNCYFELMTFPAGTTISNMISTIRKREILFKDANPKLCSRLIWYRKVYNIEMNRPEGITNNGST